jgi:hypothetical protein
MHEAQLRNLEARFRADKEALNSRKAVTVTYSSRLSGVCIFCDRDAIAGADALSAIVSDAHGERAQMSGGPLLDDMKKCRHGVPRPKICAICEPERFREMHGQDW